MERKETVNTARLTQALKRPAYKDGPRVTTGNSDLESREGCLNVSNCVNKQYGLCGTPPFLCESGSLVHAQERGGPT